MAGNTQAGDRSGNSRSKVPAPEAKQVRGERLVSKVLDVTLSELARVGYQKLSIEHVAERADVNKVTIYRRWPTKRELARAAFQKLADEKAKPADTGSLRGDMLATLRMFREVTDSPTHLALVRVLCAGPPGDEIGEIAESIRAEKDAAALKLYARAMARGELPPTTDVALLHKMLIGPAFYSALFAHERSDDRALETMVDVVLRGVAAFETKAGPRIAVKKKGPRPAAKREGARKARKR